MTSPRLPPANEIRRQVAHALAEDIGGGDLTAALVPAHARARARVICREQAVICGRAWFDEVFAQLDEAIAVTWRIADGDEVGAGALLCELEGPARPLLTGERTALNFLQLLSGTATTAHRYARLLEHSGCRVLDTRKTVPGLRLAQKYAAACGGATNHRSGLYDGVLVKENHIMAAGGIAAALDAARAQAAGMPVEVEVESLDEAAQALEAGADILLLDNFSLADLARAVAMRQQASPGKTLLEASGNVDLDTLADIAATGVDFVSVGGITKHVRAVDLSMRFTLETRDHEPG